ncbi:hypothetical protein ACFL0X_00040 [Nanoarchaeota archaeon]
MCQLCKTKPVYKFTNQRQLCKTCFTRYIEKKFLYTIRKFKLIKKQEKISTTNSNDFRNTVLKHLLKMFAEKSTIKLTNSARKIAHPNTTDTEANKIIQEIIKGNTKNLKKYSPITKENSKTIIKPLYLLFDKEVLLYAKIKKLKYKMSETKQDKIQKFLNSLEKKHPEVKQAIIQAYLQL